MDRDVFRILDRFTITGHGYIYIYMIRIHMHSNVYIGDILYDLRNNRFKIKGIEMIRGLSDRTNIKDMPLGVLFECLDGVSAEGSVIYGKIWLYRWSWLVGKKRSDLWKMLQL